MLTQIEHKSYVSLVMDHTLDPYGPNDDDEKPKRVTVAFSIWRTDNTHLAAPAWKEAVLDQFADHPVGGVGVFVVQESGLSVLKILVGIKKYNSDPSNPASKLIGHTFGYLGDVERGMAEIIKIDWGMGDITSDVNVYKETHHKKKFEDNPNTEILGPVKDDDAQVETLSVRNSVFIPFVLMAIVLEQELSPREAFLLLREFIHANQLVYCQPVLDFCRVAGTLATTGATLPVVARDTAGNITAVSIDRLLQRFMWSKVALRDLKGLRPVPVNNDSPAVREMTAAIAGLTNLSVQADARNERKREEANEAKDIETLFPGSKFKTLGCLLQVPVGESVENAAPVLYSDLANKKKNNSHLSIFTTAVRDAGKLLNIKPPIIPLNVVIPLMALNWEGYDIANLAGGILPIGFLPVGAISPKTKIARNAIMQSIQSSEDAHGNMTIADSVELNKARGNGYIPLDFSESDLQVKGFLPILVAMCGPGHAIVSEYSDSRDFIEENKLEFQDALIEECGARQAPAVQSFIFHHLVATYFRRQSNSSSRIKPHSLFDDLDRWGSGRRMDWLPSLSRVPSIDALSQKKHYVRIDAGGGGGGGGPGGGPKKSNPDLGTKVVNPNWDSRFKLNTTMGKKIKNTSIKKIIENADECTIGKGVPCNDKGEEHCLTYHGKGTCHSGCKKAYSHTPLSTAEVREMYTFFDAGCRSR